MNKYKSVEEKLLFEAIKGNDVEKVKFLLKEGVDVNAGKDKHWTPIMQASQQEYASKEIVELLIEHGADLTLKDGYIADLSWHFFVK